MPDLDPNAPDYQADRGTNPPPESASESSLVDRVAALEAQLEKLLEELGRHISLRLEPPSDQGQE